MIDYYFYFDRKDKQILVFNEDCYLRTRTLLKTERILEAVQRVLPKSKESYVFMSVAAVVFVGTVFNYLRKKKIN